MSTTTFTVRNGKKFTKTDFNSLNELFVFLREELSPLKIYLVDDEDIPNHVLKSIEKSEKEGELDVIDFQG